MNLKTKVIFSDLAKLSWVNDTFGIQKGNNAQVVIDCVLPAIISVRVVLNLSKELADKLYQEFQDIPDQTKVSAIQKLAQDHPGKEVEFYNYWISNIACLENRPIHNKLLDVYTNKIVDFMATTLKDKCDYPEDCRQKLLDLGPEFRLTAVPCTVDILDGMLEISDVKNPYVMVDYKDSGIEMRFGSACSAFLNRPLNTFSLSEADIRRVPRIVEETSNYDPHRPIHYDRLMIALTKDMLSGVYETDLDLLFRPLFAVTVHVSRLKDMMKDIGV